MRLIIVSDAWHPQVNGVVRTLENVVAELRTSGHSVEIIGPDGFPTLPCPSYPEIRLTLFPEQRLSRLVHEYEPSHIHIATEGPLGLAMRRYCLKHGWRFTTSLHTRFPEYVQARIRLPLSWGYRFLTWFHNQADRTMVATETLSRELRGWGLKRPCLWNRGVDLDLFRPRDDARDSLFPGLPRPLMMTVGRVAPEKNLLAFLDLRLAGTKIIVGDGPQLASLRQQFPEAVFTGNLHGEELARHYAAADVFVFPSLTDTFGNVMLEALASGVPVAAFPVPGPIDVITDEAVGCLHRELDRAIIKALNFDRTACRRFAEGFSWQTCASQFQDHLAPIAQDPTARNHGREHGRPQGLATAMEGWIGRKAETERKIA